MFFRLILSPIPKGLIFFIKLRYYYSTYSVIQKAHTYLVATAFIDKNLASRRGIFWSARGTSLAYYRMDQSMVDDYPFEDFHAYPVKIDYIKYPMAGRKNHEVKLVVYNLESQEHIVLDTEGPADQYLTSVSWSHDGQIYLNILNRAQDHIRTYLFNTKNRTQKLIFEHKAKKYINPHFDFFTSPEYPHETFWCSPHEGWFQLYNLDTRNKDISILTPEPKDISEIVGFKASGDAFFYTAFDSHRPSCHGYLFNRHNNIITNLTENNPGIHTIMPSDDGRYFRYFFEPKHALSSISA